MTKILLVEDDKSLREIYGVRLLAEGYDIVSAGDGEEALAIAIKERPALIISDVMMPKISGFDMLDVLRSTTETHDIKVIMMTALSSEEHRKRGEALNADRYLVKSQVGIEDVVRTVHDVLGDANESSSTAPTPAAPAAAPSPNPATPAPPPPPPPPAAPVQPTADLPSADAAQVTPLSTAAPAGQAMPTDPNPAQPSQEQPPAVPRRQTLGERTIQPLEKPEDPMAVSVADKMSQELSGGGVFASNPNQSSASAPEPVAPQAPPPPPPPATDNTTLPTPSEPPAAPAESSQPPQPNLPAIEQDEADLAAHLQFESSPQPTAAAPEQETPIDEQAGEEKGLPTQEDAASDATTTEPAAAPDLPEVPELPETPSPSPATDTGSPDTSNDEKQDTPPPPPPPPPQL